MKFVDEATIRVQAGNGVKSMFPEVARTAVMAETVAPFFLRLTTRSTRWSTIVFSARTRRKPVRVVAVATALA